jgi:hypothetical protein
MSNQNSPNGGDPKSLESGKLRASEVAAIEQALAKVGPFGEVHLVVENSRLRLIRTVRSDAFNDSTEPRSNSTGA